MQREELVDEIKKRFDVILLEVSENDKVLIFESDLDRRNLMIEISEWVGGEYRRGTVSRTVQGKRYSSKQGAVLFEDFSIFIKPTRGATEKLKINSTNLSSQGRTKFITWLDETVECYWFDESIQLKDSIIHGLTENPKVGDHLVYWVNEMMESLDLQHPWPKQTEIFEKRELGKYLGEILIGYVALIGGMDEFTYGLDEHFSKHVEFFLIPKNSNFSGIDSVIIDNVTEKMYPISSKAGRGAKASIWSNLIPCLLSKFRYLNKSILKDLLIVARNLKIDENNLSAPLQNKRIIYEYGIRNILMISNEDIPDSLSVYHDVKQKRNTKELRLVVRKIKEHPFAKDNEDLLLNLRINPKKDIFPQGITGFFCMIISSILNDDTVSINQAKDVLNSKDIIQSNLDSKKWNRDGQVHFRLTRTTNDFDFQFIGNKSGYRIISSNNGTINYEIKHKD